MPVMWRTLVPSLTPVVLLQGVYCTTDLSAVAIGNLVAVPTGVIQLNVPALGSHTDYWMQD